MAEENWDGSDTRLAVTILVIVALIIAGVYGGCRIDSQLRIDQLRLRTEACLAIGGSLIDNDCIPPCRSLEEPHGDETH